jgi:WD40 repeat protein
MMNGKVVVLDDNMIPIRSYAVHGVRVIAMAACGGYVVTAALSSLFQLKVSDPSNGAITDLPGHTDRMTGVVSARYGYSLLSIAKDGALKVWSTEGPPKEWILVYTLRAEESVLGDNAHPTNMAVIDTEVVCGYSNGKIIVWDFVNGAIVRTIVAHDEIVSSVTRIGQIIYTASEEEIKQWSWKDGTFLLLKSTNTAPFRNVAMIGYGSHLVVSRHDNDERDRYSSICIFDHDMQIVEVLFEKFQAKHVNILVVEGNVYGSEWEDIRRWSLADPV